jgi:hypothetical protein
MKRFIIIGAVLASAAVCVLLAHQKVFTETKLRHSEKMIITVSTQTGEILSILDEGGNKPTELTPEQADKIYRTVGFRYVGVILYHHLSPGCVSVDIGGTTWVFCY